MQDRDATIALVDSAFAAVERPPDRELLHPDCSDDSDLHGLYGVAHWKQLPDALAVSEYAALAFLSPEGFRHFIPAYITWVLRNPESGEAVVDATVWAFDLELYPQDLRPFVRSRWRLLDGGQQEAVRAFLEFMTGHHQDADRALGSFS